MTTLQRFPNWLAAAALALLAACGGGGGTSAGADPGGRRPPDAAPPGSAVIGRDGGSVMSADGKVRLEIPAGALGNDTTITIESVDPADVPAELAGSDVVYDLKPDGLQFARPVQAAVELPGTPLQADGSLMAAAGALVSLAGGQLEALGEQTINVDGAANRITAQGTLTHFSSLVFTRRLATGSGIEVGDPGFLYLRLKPMPKLMVVGKTERATLETAIEGFTPNEVIGGQYRYQDLYGEPGSRPFRHLPDLPLPVVDGYYVLGREVPLPLPRTTALGRYGDYVCTLPGPALLEVPTKVADLNVFLRFVNRLVPLNEVTFAFQSTHSCVRPSSQLPPPPPPAPDDGARVVPVQVPGLEGLIRFRAAFAPFFEGEVDEQRIADDFGIPVERVNSILGGAWNGGMGLIDLATGELLRRKDTFMPMYGVLPAYKDGAGCLAGFGPITGTSCYDRAFGDYGLTEIGVGGGPVSDIGLLGNVQTPAGLRSLKWNVGAGNLSYELRRDDGSIGSQSLLKPFGASKGWYVGGALVGLAKSAAFNADASRVVVASGGADADGQLWYGDPADPAGGKLVGSLGAGNRDARQVRCEPQRAGGGKRVCAVSNFGGWINVFTWDGIGAPQMTADVPDTGGAVGIDVVVEGDRRAIFAADYRNDTVTKIMVDADGGNASKVTKPLPAGCTKPGHAIGWQQPDGRLGAVVSCNGADADGNSAIVVIGPRFFD